MNYPIKCPYCPLSIDSMDSYADSKQDLRYHIQYKHPGENFEDEADLSSNSGSSDSVRSVRSGGQAKDGSEQRLHR